MRKGFTLVEMVIVIVVSIILSLISAPIYQNHVLKAKLAEGYALAAAIRDAQQRYYSEYGNFLYGDTGGYTENRGYTCYNKILGINASGNKYFSYFTANHYTGSANANKGYAFLAIVKSADAGEISMGHNITGGAIVNYSR